MTETKKGPFSFEILKNPVLILFAMGAGIASGIFLPEFSKSIFPAGQVYLDLLRMTIFPILITAIITSIGKLFTHDDAQQIIGKIILILLSFLLITAVVSIVLGIVIAPGSGLSEEAQITLGKTLSVADKTGEGSMFFVEEKGFFAFLKQMIPQNIFKSMGSGASLQILFFSIMLGIAVGFLPDKNRNDILNISEALFKAFFTIIEWVMYLLPFGLFCLMSGQIANTGVDTIFAMAKFVGVMYLVAFLLFITSGILISWSTKSSIFTVLNALKDSLLIAFGTQSTFASMPAAIEGLSERLKVNRELVNLLIPLGAVIARYSMIMLYGVATVFAAQLYNIQLAPVQLLLALFLVVLAAIAGAGTPGIVSLTMISIIFAPLGLPSAAIIILLLGVNPVIEPVTTMCNMFAVSASTAVISRNQEAL